MRSLTISMPDLTVFESNNTRKNQVRLFAHINNRIDFKIINYAINCLKMQFHYLGGKFCPVISALNYSLPVVYNALMKQKHVKGEISKKN